MANIETGQMPHSIWVFTDCSDLSVRILRINMIYRHVCREDVMDRKYLLLVSYDILFYHMTVKLFSEITHVIKII